MFHLRVLIMVFLCGLATSCRKSVGEANLQVASPPRDEVWASSESLAAAQIVLDPVAPRELGQRLLATGTVAFDDQRVVHVFSPVTGRIARIDASLGQRVKKGDPLARIQSPDIGQASAELSKATADYILAEHNYQRKQDLYEQHAAAAADLEAAEDAYRKAKAERERALEKRKLFARGSIDEVTQTYTLISPIDGEIISRTVNPGTEIQGQYGGGSAVELFTVGDLGRVWLVADIFEMDLARVRVGAPVEVSVVSYPDRRFDGKIDWISETIDPNTRTAKVRCVFENPDGALRPAMFANASISVDSQPALAIPRSALLRTGADTVVFVRVGTTADGRIRLKCLPVRLNDGQKGPWLPAPAGLAPGTAIATSNAIMLLGML